MSKKTKSFRLTDEDKDILESIASKSGLTQSKVIRAALRGAVPPDDSTKPHKYFSDHRVEFKEMKPEDVEHVPVDNASRLFLAAFCSFMGKTYNGVHFPGNARMMLYDQTGTVLSFYRFPSLVPAWHEHKAVVREFYELERSLHHFNDGERRKHPSWPRYVDLSYQLNDPEAEPNSVTAMLGKVLWQEWCYGCIRHFSTRSTPQSMVTRHEYDEVQDMRGNPVVPSA